MSKIDIKNVRFEIISSKVNGYKEVQAIFDYQGKIEKYFIFIKEGKNVDYIKEAKKQFAKDVASGRVNKTIKPIRNPFIITGACVLGALAITFATLYTYKVLNGGGGGEIVTNEHVVTFETNGGTHIDTVKVKDKEVINEPTSPTKTGYTFGGWYISPEFEGESYSFNTPVENDLVLYANWGYANTYTITYKNLLDSSTTNPTAYNVTTDTIVLSDPTDRGYAFTGWRKNDASGELITEIPQGSSGNLTLYATWNETPTTYDITYSNLQGTSTENPKEYTIETSTITLSNPEGDSGYDFIGWRKGGASGEFVTEIPQGSFGDLTLWATWSTAPTSYTITYENLLGSTTTNPVTYNAATDTIILTDPTDHGYAFTGWRKNNASGELITEIPQGSSGDLTLWATWSTTPTSYNITYANLQGSTTTNPETYTTITDTITLSNPTDHGYAFTGWHKDSPTGQSVTKIEKGSIGDIHLYASWNTTATSYSIEYENLKGTTTTNPTGYTIESETITLNNPEGDPGYAFTGWRKDSVDGDPIIRIPHGSIGNLTLYATWSTTPTPYTITYQNLKEGTTTTNPTSYTVESGTITLNNPEGDPGYAFTGWRKNDASGDPVTEISQGSIGNITLWATWSETPTEYDIEYLNLLSSTTTNPQKYTLTTPTITLTDPTDHGYAFTGWRKNDASGDPVTEISQGSIGNITLWATWSETPTTYTITYKNLKGGTTTNPTSYKVTSDSISLTNPTGVVGYTFTGWHKGSETGDVITTIPQGSFGDLDIYASWSDPIQYTISYELDGGTVEGENPTGYDVTKTINLINPEQDGFTFTDWYLDSAKTQKLSRSGWDPGEVSGNVTLYAGWKSNKTLEEYNWPEISDISATGNASKYFSVGDTKTITLNNQEHTVRIIGFNHDTLTNDTTQTAGITFEFVNVITESGGGATPTYWNNTADNTNFPSSTFNTLLNDPTDSIYTKLKAITGDVIKQVKKGVGTSSDTAETTPYELSIYDTYLFPLAHDEMADHDDQEIIEGEGSKYQYYVEHNQPADLVKTAVGSASGQTYWNRSPKATLDYKVRAYCFNSSATKFNFGVVNLNEYCVAPAFCI